MGASGWIYFVPYQEDAEAALQALRQDIFRQGKYYRPTWRVAPTSMDEALSAAKDSGTHSIIDMLGVSTQPTFQHVSLLSPETLETLIHTARPDRAAVEDKRYFLYERIKKRWYGHYFVVYAGDQPESLCFIGVSGD